MEGTGYRDRMAVAMRTALFLSGMDPGDLAARLGIATETVRRWTRGDVELRLSSLAAICDALDVPADLFVRPPASREQAMLMIAAHRGTQRGLAETQPPS